MNTTASNPATYRPSEDCIISVQCHRTGFSPDLGLLVFLVLPPTRQSICLSDRTRRWATDERQETQHWRMTLTILKSKIKLWVLCCWHQFLFMQFYCVHIIGKLYKLVLICIWSVILSVRQTLSMTQETNKLLLSHELHIHRPDVSFHSRPKVSTGWSWGDLEANSRITSSLCKSFELCKISYL